MSARILIVDDEANTWPRFRAPSGSPDTRRWCATTRRERWNWRRRNLSI